MNPSIGISATGFLIETNSEIKPKEVKRIYHLAMCHDLDYEARPQCRLGRSMGQRQRNVQLQEANTGTETGGTEQKTELNSP
jgi:hypothetical protein